MRQKIIIPSAAAVVALAVVSFAVFGMTDENQTASVEPQPLEVSMVIEDNNYVKGRLLPPDDYILDIGEMLDLEDNRGHSSPYYNDVKDVFPGYDEIIIIDHTWENTDPAFIEPLTTHIFLTKDPFEYETFTGEFYYDMVGITIIITEKQGHEKYTMQYEKNPDDVYKRISDDLIGVGKEKFKGIMLDGSEFDVPTRLHFVDNENIIEITGFLTLEQASELAKVLQR